MVNALSFGRFVGWLIVVMALCAMTFLSAAYLFKLILRYMGFPL